MRISMIGAEWFGTRPGGLNRYFTDLFAALRGTAGVEVDGWAFGDAEAGGRSLGPARTSLPRRMAARPQELEGADVVDRHFALYGNGARIPRGALRVFHFQGPWADESALSGQGGAAVRAKRLLEREVYRRIDRLVVLCAPFAGILSERYGVPADRITVIPPGVDLERFAVAPQPDRPVVLCVRRLERRMGIDVLIRAWPAVRAVVPDAELRIVGTGTYETELRRLADGAGPGIVFLGRLDDDALAGAYRDARLTAVPSLALEGFGLIALESLAVGRAPVVTDCGGLPDAVRDLDPTLIVPIGDVDALAARLITALEGAVPSAAECRAHAATFSWTIIAERHRALYAAGSTR